MVLRMTKGHPRPWPGLPRHAGLISASYTSHPRFRHQLSSDPASRRTPLPRRMVPVITVHRGLTPLECTSLLDTPGEPPVPPRTRRRLRRFEGVVIQPENILRVLRRIELSVIPFVVLLMVIAGIASAQALDPVKW